MPLRSTRKAIQTGCTLISTAAQTTGGDSACVTTAALMVGVTLTHASNTRRYFQTTVNYAHPTARNSAGIRRLKPLPKKTNYMKPGNSVTPQTGGLSDATCSPSSGVLSDFEKGPWSYDLYGGGGLEPVALLNSSDHSQGEWVDIDDYRKLERQLAAWTGGASEIFPFGIDDGTPILFFDSFEELKREVAELKQERDKARTAARKLRDAFAAGEQLPWENPIIKR